MAESPTNRCHGNHDNHGNQWRFSHLPPLFIVCGLTGDVQVQGDPVRAQVVAGHGRDVVDAHSAVHVADPVLDGAGVGVRHRRAVAKVQRYASGGARTLRATQHTKHV